MDDIKSLSLEDLAALAVEKREALDALFAIEGTPTDEQVAEAEGLAEDIAALSAESDSRAEAAAARDEKFAALKGQFADKGADDEDEETEEERKAREAEEQAAADEEAAATAAAEDEAAAAGKDPVVASGKRPATKRPRPKAPVLADEKRVTITASADTGFATGAEIDLDGIGVALQNRVRGFARPSSAMRGADIPMQHYGVASIRTETPEELVIDKTKDHMAVLAAAAQESRLPNGSLTAAGGWCAPSETIYDLCEGETLEGLISVPEVTVRRGGINFTKGPQFADFYGVPWTDGAGFLQTEAQAIAGDTKDCFTIECPEFDEVRLDAVGLCIKVPILTETGYPELVRRITSGSLTAHQHRLSWEVIKRMVALSGAARDFTLAGKGATVTDSLEAFGLVADQRREQYRLALNSSMEVILPFWVKAMFKNDLARRSAVGVETVSDAQLTAHFTERHLAVQFVYNWQPLGALVGAPVELYPASYQALMYPAGTFVVGKADVINLSAVYDAASLQENVYTGTFMEQGLLVANMCYDSNLITLPVCNAGRTGAQDLTCA